MRTQSIPTLKGAGYAYADHLWIIPP